MASYEKAASTVLSDIESAGLSASTEAAIKALISESGDSVAISDYDGSTPVPENTQIVNVPAGTNLTSDPGAGEVIIMGAGSSANVTFGADSTVETLVLGDGVSKVAFEGDKNITIEMTGGNDSVSTGAGEDVFTINGGNASVSSGEGNDVIHLQGDNTGSASINAGDGFDRLNLEDSRGNHEFGFNAATGKFTMHSNVAVTMSGVQVVSFDKNADGQITGADNITILAENKADSLVAKLYKVALGREAIDGADGWGDSTLGGINWWMNEFEKGETDGTIEHLVRSFLNCDEFNNLYNGKSNAEYTSALFANLGAQTVNGKTAADYAAALDAGTMDKAQVAWEVADSQEAVDLLGLEGEQYVIDGFTTN